MHAKDACEGLKHLNDSKAFIEYSHNIGNIYKNIEKYNPNKNHKVLTRFDDIIADMFSNKKLDPVVIEPFIRVKRLNISFSFIIQSYFAVLQNTRLNSTNYFIMKVPNKQELWQIAFNHSSDIETELLERI